MAEIEFTDDDVVNLGRKLSGLDLNGTEKALMNALLGLAAKSMRTVQLTEESAGPSVIVSDLGVDDQPDPGEQVPQILPPTTPPTSPTTFSSVRGEPVI